MLDLGCTCTDQSLPFHDKKCNAHVASQKRLLTAIAKEAIAWSEYDNPLGQDETKARAIGQIARQMLNSISTQCETALLLKTIMAFDTVFKTPESTDPFDYLSTTNMDRYAAISNAVENGLNNP